MITIVTGAVFTPLRHSSRNQLWLPQGSDGSSPVCELLWCKLFCRVGFLQSQILGSTCSTGVLQGKGQHRDKETGNVRVQCDPQSRVRENESKQLTRLRNRNPAEGFYGVQMGEYHVMPPRFPRTPSDPLAGTKGVNEAKLWVLSPKVSRKRHRKQK